MLLIQSKLDVAFLQIRDDSVNQGSTVLVLAAPSVDALCACRALLTLLKQEFIQFKLLPVFGYEDLARVNEQLIKDNTELKSIVMFDCGGLVDLSEFLSLSEQMTVYLFDSHRPLHLSNVDQANEQVFVVVDDDEAQRDVVPVIEAYTIDTYGRPDEDEDVEFGENEIDIDEVAPTEKATTTRDDSRQPRRKRKRQMSLADEQMQREQRKRLIREYYRGGAWHGAPVSLSMWTMVQLLGKQTSELLWLAIVGLTDQYVHERVDAIRYTHFKDMLEIEVSKMNPDSSMSQDTTAKSILTQWEDGSDMHIVISREYRFMHFRHWSLFDAMLHSPYIATRLGIWRESGKRKLHELLAKAGLPLDDVKQQFSSMDLEVKKCLQERLEQVCRHDSTFRIHDLTFGSFVLQVGFNMLLSASDVVHAVSAFLETGPTGEGNRVDEEKENSEPAGGRDGQGQRPTSSAASADDLWLDNFYQAYDALDWQKIAHLKVGIQKSMAFQKAVVEQAMTLINTRSITTTKQLRVVNMTDGQLLKYFAHPLTLTRLALFLMTALHETKRARLPIVVAALRPQLSTYMVVGVSHSSATMTTTEDRARNKLSLGLREAAKTANVSFKHDGFEASVIEVDRADFPIFWDKLQSLVLSGS